MEYKVGGLVQALAGHDKGKLYVVVAVEEKQIFLANGREKLLAAPKKKNKRHVQLIMEETQIKIWNDDFIRRAVITAVGNQKSN